MSLCVQVSRFPHVVGKEEAARVLRVVAPPAISPCAGLCPFSLVHQPIAAVAPPPAPNEEIGMVVSSTMFQPVAWMTR